MPSGNRVPALLQATRRAASRAKRTAKRLTPALPINTRAAKGKAHAKRNSNARAAESTPEQLKRKAADAGRMAAKRAAKAAPKLPTGAKAEADSAADAEKKEHGRQRRAIQKQRKVQQHAENVLLAPKVAVQSQPRANAVHTYRHRHVFTPVPDGLKVRPRIGTDQWKSMDASRAQLRSHLASQQFFEDSTWVPGAFQDSSHTMKAGFLSASLLDKIKASNICEACSWSCIENSVLSGPRERVDHHKFKHKRRGKLSGYFCYQCSRDLENMSGVYDVQHTRNAKLVRQPGSMAMVLPQMTLSEEMVIARAHFRVAVHQVRQGNLRYKGCCLFVQKDESHCAVEGLWRPQAIPLVVVRYGEVGIHQVTHQDLLIRPKVVCAWWR